MLPACAVRLGGDDFGSVGSGGGGPHPVEASDGSVGSGDDAGTDASDASGLGSVFVDASVSLEQDDASFECPGITVFSITSAALAPGQQASLVVETVGPPAAVQWSVSPAGGGTFSDATALTTTFVCSEAGRMTITVTAWPPDGGSCASSRFAFYTAAIDCLAS
jgi:hypothetical protein